MKPGVRYGCCFGRRTTMPVHPRTSVDAIVDRVFKTVYDETSLPVVNLVGVVKPGALIPAEDGPAGGRASRGDKILRR